MGNPNAERRLAAASAACDAARAEYEKAVSQAVARPKPAAGWRELQGRAVEAAVALGVAQAELNAAKRDAGLLAAPARPAGGKVLVALVRVPDRAAAALLHGPGDWASGSRRRSRCNMPATSTPTPARPETPGRSKSGRDSGRTPPTPTHSRRRRSASSPPTAKRRARWRQSSKGAPNASRTPTRRKGRRGRMKRPACRGSASRP